MWVYIIIGAGGILIRGNKMKLFKYVHIVSGEIGGISDG